MTRLDQIIEKLDKARFKNLRNPDKPEIKHLELSIQDVEYLLDLINRVRKETGIHMLEKWHEGS